jgi:hypothetical protein
LININNKKKKKAMNLNKNKKIEKLNPITLKIKKNKISTIKNTNEKYWYLIESFKKIGIPICIFSNYFIKNENDEFECNSILEIKNFNQNKFLKNNFFKSSINSKNNFYNFCIYFFYKEEEEESKNPENYLKIKFIDKKNYFIIFELKLKNENINNKNFYLIKKLKPNKPHFDIYKVNEHFVKSKQIIMKHFIFKTSVKIKKINSCTYYELAPPDVQKSLDSVIKGYLNSKNSSSIVTRNRFSRIGVSENTILKGKSKQKFTSFSIKNLYFNKTYTIGWIKKSDDSLLKLNFWYTLKRL